MNQIAIVSILALASMTMGLGCAVQQGNEGDVGQSEDELAVSSATATCSGGFTIEKQTLPNSKLCGGGGGGGVSELAHGFVKSEGCWTIKTSAEESVALFTNGAPFSSLVGGTMQSPTLVVSGTDSNLSLTYELHLQNGTGALTTYNYSNGKNAKTIYANCTLSVK